jgi:endonuclease YncB( thermonuclease family)
MGIDTPESRTRDKVEKLFGLASKKRLKELLSKTLCS